MESKKERRSTNSPLFRWHEEMVRHLQALLRDFALTQKINVDNVEKLVDAIYIDQTRAPWPGSALSSDKKEDWRNFVKRSSKILIYSNTSAAFSEFASKISTRILRELSASQISSTLLSDEAIRNTQVESMIRQEFYFRGSASDTVSRSIQRYLRADAKTRRERSEIKMPEDDPMREILNLPRIGRSLLPKEDLRVHLARYLRSSAIDKHLRKASAFSKETMSEAIGEDFLALGKPIGFADHHYRVLLIDVASASAAQELALNKANIIARLKKIAGFAKLQDIKFRISQNSAPSSST